MNIGDLEKLVRPLKTRIMNMVSRATIKVSKIDSAQLEVFGDEIRDDVDRVQEWGFSSMPPDGSDGVVVFVGGNRDHGVVIASGNRKDRPPLEAGESAMWTKDVVIKIDKDKKVTVTGAESVEFMGSSKHLVTWEDLNSALAQFATSAISHTHNVTAPGSPSGPAVGFPSFDISAAKATKLKTGG